MCSTCKVSGINRVAVDRKGGDRARSPPSSFHAWAAVILLPFPLVARTPLLDGPLAYMEPKKPLVAGVQRVEQVPG